MTLESQFKHHDSDHKHYEHSDHLDHGVVDFIFCVLNESNHADSDDEQCDYMSVNTSSIYENGLNKTFVIAFYLSSFLDTQIEDNSQAFKSEEYRLGIPPSIDCSSPRGPPTVSC